MLVDKDGRTSFGGGSQKSRGLIYAVVCGVAAVLLAPAIAMAQDQGVPFKMQEVDEQVINGVRIQKARVPVWTDPTGRPASRPSASTPNRVNQDELNELARIGRPDSRYDMAPPPGLQGTPAPIQRSAPAGPQFDVVGAPLAAAGAASPATGGQPAAVHRRPRSDDDELAELKRAVASAEASVRKKEKQIEDRKLDEARRAEEARLAAQREAERRSLVFEATSGQMLSAAISAYVGRNGWENVEWNVGPDFQIKYPYSERPKDGEGLKEVLLKVLRPFGLSAELHRPNSVVEIFPADETAARN